MTESEFGGMQRSFAQRLRRLIDLPNHEKGGDFRSDALAEKIEQSVDGTRVALRGRGELLHVVAQRGEARRDRGGPLGVVLGLRGAPKIVKADMAVNILENPTASDHNRAGLVHKGHPKISLRVHLEIAHVAIGESCLRSVGAELRAD